jgi:beta-xylosidase
MTKFSGLWFLLINDYYLVSSSFTNVPRLPILHSRDLVNWTLIGHYPDPDFGVFVTTATNPAGPWSDPQLVDNSRGVIDPCPFWDDDGSAWYSSLRRRAA